MNILFVTTFATKFYLKELGEVPGAKDVVNYTVFWTYHAFCLQNSAPAPAETDLLLVPPERHALCTYRFGFRF